MRQQFKDSQTVSNCRLVMEGVNKEGRRFTRFDIALPIEFQFMDNDKKPISSVFQGFVKNASKGGLCVEVKAISSRDVFRFTPRRSKLKLIVNLPASFISTETYGTVTWSREIPEGTLTTHIFGIEYDEIATQSQRMIYLYILWLHNRTKLLILFLAVLLTIIATAIVLFWLWI